MEVVEHQAVGQQSHLVAGDRLAQDPLECRIVVVIVEDGEARIGAIEGMIDESAFRRSSWSWQRCMLTAGECGDKNGS